MRYNGTLITISHDRHFLNSVCTHIADIDYETIILYNGGYDDMVEQKTAIRSRIESQNEQREKKIAQLNDFIARFSAGTRSSQVNSRKKEVERLAVTELARSNIQRPYIRFEQKRPSGKHILEIEDVSKAYEQKDGSPLAGDRQVLRLLSARRQDRPDGPQRAREVDHAQGAAGQRSRRRRDRCVRRSGVVKWGHEAQIGYFPQDLKASIELGMTVNDWLHQFDEDATKEDIRGILGQMLFRGEEGLKMTDALSGGEAARLLFCKLMLQKPNVLVLDEPSNHLDLEAINALNLALQKYEGTVLLVTHDLDLIDEVATRIWHFEGGPAHFRIEDFKGPYADYQQQMAAAK